MAEDVDEQAAWTAQEGKSKERGKTFNPTEEDACNSSTEAAKPQAVPIGRPINSHDYDQLKERARDEGPLSEGNAVEDSPATSAANGGEDNG